MIKPAEIELIECTGVQDKNGEDIYEGDIIEYFHPHMDEDEPGV